MSNMGNKIAESISRKVVSSILNASELSINTWIEKLKTPKAVPAKSTVSEWRSGKRSISPYYEAILINVLLSDEELIEKADSVRKRIICDLDIHDYQKIYLKLQKMEYGSFLKYVLDDMSEEELHDKEINWDAIDFLEVMDLLMAKINKLSKKQEIGAKVDIIQKKGILTITYNKHIDGLDKSYSVKVYFHKGQGAVGFFKKNIEISENDILTIIFTTNAIKNRQYLEIMKNHQMMIFSIDTFDLDAIKEYESYIPVKGVSDAKAVFMNKLTELMFQKISEQNYIVLKEILSRSYKKDMAEYEFIHSNASVWEYKYPIRCAMDFEKGLLEEMVKSLIHENRSPRILDINLAGGIYGLRLSENARNVTCVDAAPGCLGMIEEIIERYNKSVPEGKKTIDNVDVGYIRPDNFTILDEKSKKKQYELIIVGLGSASYIHNLKDFLRKISSWLTDDGKILISVYNTNALCRYSFNIENMDFLFQPENFRYRDAEWDLQVNTYSCQEIFDIVNKQHSVERIYSYPTLLSVTSEHQDKRIMEYIRKTDRVLAQNSPLSKGNQLSDRGMYNIICASKLNQMGIVQCFNETKKFITNEKLEVTEVEHDEIYSRQLMQRELNKKGIIIKDNFIKSVLLYDKKNKICFWVLLLLEDKFQIDYLSEWYKKNNNGNKMPKNSIKLYRERQLSELKLASGSISLFAYPSVKEIIKNERNEKIVLLYDKSIESRKNKYYYTYSGNVKMTWKIKKSSLLQYIRDQGGIAYSK